MSIRSLVLIILCASLLAVGSAMGKAMPGPYPGYLIHVEKQDGTNFDARLKDEVRIETEYGTETFPLTHLIRRITFKPDQPSRRPMHGRSAAIIELKDKTILRGRIPGEEWTFAVNDKDQKIPFAELRELRSIDPPKTGWLAIAIGLLTLTAMEIVLGIDNVIFLAILAGKLPPEQQPRARRLGLMAALGTRLLLLATLTFLLGLTRPLFTLPEMPLLHDMEAREVSLRDLILLAGGLFLIGKSVMEMHEKLENARQHGEPRPNVKVSFIKVLIQIAVIDIVFSLDSVITAVGMVEELWVMVAAMVLAMLVMLVFAGAIGAYVARHPTLKVLALSFLILIGVMLVAESLGQHMNKGYIYFAMAFALAVEAFNLRIHPKVSQSETAQLPVAEDRKTI